MSETAKHTPDVAFLLEAARFFDGTAAASKEDIAFWANTQNAANCRRIAETITDMLEALKSLVIESGGKAIPNESLSIARNQALAAIARASAPQGE